MYVFRADHFVFDNHWCAFSWERVFLPLSSFLSCQLVIEETEVSWPGPIFSASAAVILLQFMFGNHVSETS